MTSVGRAVYLTGFGKFFPGPPISNDEMEAYLGQIHGRASRLRKRILESNGIRSRHYGIDVEQRSHVSNSEMATRAVEEALDRACLPLQRLEFLAAATTQGDLLVPGFASTVHRKLGGQAMRVASHHGVCSSGMMALQHAALAVRASEVEAAVVCASEFPSRLFKASRYAEQTLGERGTLPFDTEFLRWMLSDGAGAAVLQAAPRTRGVSLKLEWLRIRSHAHALPLAMYAGENRHRGQTEGPASWLDHPSFQEAAAAGALNLKQDVRDLDAIVKLGVDEFFRCVDEHRLDPGAIDWMVCHYSSNVFKGDIVRLLALGGVRIDEDRWFSNLTTRGNVGAASPLVMLEELVEQGHAQPGQRVLLVVPESGGAIIGIALFEVVAGAAPPVAPGAGARAVARVPAISAPALDLPADPVREKLVRELTHVWCDFEARLRQVPAIARLYAGAFTLEDYRSLLLDLRQQVVEGARWIARAASNVDLDAFPIRSSFLGHAVDEHRDYQLLEEDYVSVGGQRDEILGATKNIGSEALSAWMFHRASQPNPFDLLGAMFIIEGMGAQIGSRWAAMIQEQLGLSPDQLRFLRYHSQNDDNHLEKLETALRSPWLDEAMAERIVKTAKVTARLYALQLEELGHR